MKRDLGIMGSRRIVYPPYSKCYLYKYCYRYYCLIATRQWNSQNIQPQVSPRDSRITSYNVCYTKLLRPLHYLLLRDNFLALVMTSGNLSDEPIAFDDADAVARLSGLADAFLVHDRRIEIRTDDSIARVMAGKALLLRRSRGYRITSYNVCYTKLLRSTSWRPKPRSSRWRRRSPAAAIV